MTHKHLSVKKMRRLRVQLNATLRVWEKDTAKYGCIPLDSTSQDLWVFRKFKLRTKRQKKKFHRNPEKYLSQGLCHFLRIRKVAKVSADIMRAAMGRSYITLNKATSSSATEEGVNHVNHN